MSIVYRRLKKISRLLPPIAAGRDYQQSRQAIKFYAESFFSLPNSPQIVSTSFLDRGCLAQRYATASEVSQDSNPQLDLLPFIESTINELQGPSHYWLNRGDGNMNDLKKGGTYLVLAGQFLNNSHVTGRESTVTFENLKLIQQRFPQLCIMGFQSGDLSCFAADQSRLAQLLIKDYLTFPILMSDKYFPETADGACYILSKEFTDPVIFHAKGLDVEVLSKAVEELNEHCDKKSRTPEIFSITWSKYDDIARKPQFCSPLQDFLLYFPGCVSADESGNRLFISDSNHHRIIVSDDNGKILDSIGSCPGFEDGEFESAKLLRPAASFYDDAEDCLYIVDSENHAIRRADFQKRILETVYPSSGKIDKKTGLWTWIKDKLGLKKDVDAESDEIETRALIFPWHIMKSSDDSFVITTQSFETLWVMNLSSGEVEEVVEGVSEVLEVCGELITKKVSLLNQMPSNWLQHQMETTYSPSELPYASLLSSLTILHNDVIMSDTVGQRLLRLRKESGVCSTIRFSNFAVLGLPYWLTQPLERVSAVGSGLKATPIDHAEYFSLLPGEVKIRLNIEIPASTELVEPLEDSFIWRQVRGNALEVSMAETIGGSIDQTPSLRVGLTQQWYDELDNLIFEPPEIESDEDTSLDVKVEDDNRPHIDCTINTSPGTSEVTIYSALYLKLVTNSESDQKKYAATIANILKPERSGGMSRDAFVKLLLKSDRDLRDLIFIKPLHVRIKFNTPLHPVSNSATGILLTDSSVVINVSLNK